ncbi:ACP S-malonyltransferase [Massilia atriviolacea]|uniref:[acyl-carrier-protein] S-malonyltransferase n=1 Tax=Massilia atriviolacea TaxID=2495579 RepID=A0A430HSH3_9BURK|nr:ACP S-malonyltransferase [Massilia atriviolacea]RSZ60424.1 [acyl-carrier-protein] S-malonyltransferase [Massilia atriviolacea]
MKTYMFPGQGSQSKEMGAGLFERYPELTAKADRILGYSIEELCMQDPRDELGKTRFTQPALYVVNALSYYRKLEDSGQAPDFLAGHSLGEFNALLAADCFDFETGLKLVQKRGELMAQVGNGAMAAVLNASKEDIEGILKANGISQVYLANYNTPSQIVLSGLSEEIAAVQKFFQAGKMRYYPLATSGAFHSAFMQDAMEKFRDFLKEFTFAAPTIPVIANVTARPYRADAMLDTLSAQIASTVRWSESIQYLLALGRARGAAPVFEELGHGDVLTKLAMTIKLQTPETVLDQLIKDGLAGEAAEAPVSAPIQLNDAQEKIAHWKKMHPIGTRVRSSLLNLDDLETRTDAVLLFGHRAAVYLKGYNGYFALDELTPM